LEESGKLVGSNLFGANTYWMLLWLPAAVVKPLCSSCALGAAIAYTGQAGVWEVQAANVVGSLASFYEAYLVLTDQVLNSASPDNFWGLLAWGVASGIVVVYGRGMLGFRWLLAGYLLRTAGYLFLLLAPCRIDFFDKEEAREACSYPQDQLHNVVFHVLVAVSLPPLLYGAKQKHDKDVEYEELLNRRAAEQEARAKEKQSEQSRSWLNSCTTCRTVDFKQGCTTYWSSSGG